MPRRPALPKDPSQRAKALLDMATGERPKADSGFSPAQKFAQSGGLKGGKSRAASLTEQRRKEIAKKAASARWKRGPAAPGTKEPV